MAGNSVRPGDKLRITAADWNRLLALADRLDQLEGRSAPPTLPPTRSDLGRVLIKNTYNRVIAAYSPVALTGVMPELNPAGNPDDFRRVVFLAGSPVTNAVERYAITQQRTAPGAIGEAMLYGVTRVNAAGATLGLPYSQWPGKRLSIATDSEQQGVDQFGNPVSWFRMRAGRAGEAVCLHCSDGGGDLVAYISPPAAVPDLAVFKCDYPIAGTVLPEQVQWYEQTWDPVQLRWENAATPLQIGDPAEPQALRWPGAVAVCLPAGMASARGRPHVIGGDANGFWAKLSGPRLGFPDDRGAGGYTFIQSDPPLGFSALTPTNDRHGPPAGGGPAPNYYAYDRAFDGYGKRYAGGQPFLLLRRHDFNFEPSGVAGERLSPNYHEVYLRRESPALVSPHPDYPAIQPGFYFYVGSDSTKSPCPVT